MAYYFIQSTYCTSSERPESLRGQGVLCAGVRDAKIFIFITCKNISLPPPLLLLPPPPHHHHKHNIIKPGISFKTRSASRCINWDILGGEGVKHLLFSPPIGLLGGLFRGHS